jgi:hypothetical protein
MFAKSCVLMLLIACHTSSPSVTSGSGTAEPSASPQPAGSAMTPAPPQNDASAPPPGAPAAIPPVPHHPAQPPVAAAPGISETCGAQDSCSAGLTCVSYYGFAGTQGPHFKSCEVRCETDTVCPKGRTCMTVSDGPGRVCR